MLKLDVKTAFPYSVHIGSDCLDKLGAYVRKSVPSAKKIMIVTDTNVSKFYLVTVKNILEQEGFTVFEFVFCAGEANKNFQTFLAVCNALGQNGFLRSDCVVALGGGVVGDVAGFSASVYMRGIPFVQVPTSLLAVIDSSVGGKTGVDTPYGKNNIGTFYQPKLVFADTETLKTLPKSEIKNGLGEGVKYSVLSSDVTLGGDLLDFCVSCLRYKIKLIEQDETDRGIRRLLNLGHTVGHALEKLSAYSIPHGEAVAQGLYACVLSAAKNGKLERHDAEKIINNLKNHGFEKQNIFSKSEILSAVFCDKKATEDGIVFIDIEKVGQCVPRFFTMRQFEEYLVW